jgi:DNA-binding NarL/FixJ family response regulator
MKMPTTNEALSEASTDSLLRTDGVCVPPEDVARIWRELTLGQWRVLAAMDVEGTRHAAIAPLRKRVIRWEMLRPRERQVLAVAARGESQKVIVSELGVTASTVSNALHTARVRLGFGCVAELVRAYEANDPLAKKE